MTTLALLAAVGLASGSDQAAESLRVGVLDYIPLERACEELGLAAECEIEALVEVGRRGGDGRWANGVWAIAERSDGLYVAPPPDEAELREAVAYRNDAEADYPSDVVVLYDDPADDDRTPYELPEGDLRVTPLTIVSDGQTGSKQIFGSESRQQTSDPYGYPYTKFVQFHLDRPTDPLPAEEYLVGCSGAFVLDATHVLTAAHCVYDTLASGVDGTPAGLLYANDNEYSNPTDIDTGHGIDRGYGYVCYRNGPYGEAHFGAWDFEDECEFVDSRVVSPDYIAVTSPFYNIDPDYLEGDYAILELQTVNFPNGLGDGRWMALSSLDTAAQYESKVPVNHGNPGAHPNGTSNMFQHVDYGPWMVRAMSQYWSAGAAHTATTNQRLCTTVDSASGHSGSAIFYYSDNGTTYTGQGHYIIGLMTALIDWGGSSDEWNGGPTVHQFRDFVEANVD